MKLEPEFKKKWIEALRSGEYRQCKGRLHTVSDNSFCCLGVAGDLCGVPKDTLDGNLGLLSNVLLNKYQIPKYLKRTNSIYAQQVLAEMNDSGKSFNEIADYIEKQL